ncbi:MAG: erythromycin esterase family protein [Chloroflexota bacterium]|nr:erythromycin esterase family protein [Chloroflexota bacterium]MDQ5867894.1 erythromycin esterase family protein [Chloroflexota bacterium]
MRSTRATRLVMLTLALLALLSTTVYSAGPTSSTPATSYTGSIYNTLAQQPDSRIFPETGRTVKGRFLKYWQEHGGLAQQGFPLSDEMQERSEVDGKTYTVQYFERAVFEHHPENQPPYDVLLSLLGALQYNQKYPKGAPNQTPNTSEGSVLFPETGKRVGGAFLRYWQTHGGLPQQGYPVSDQFSEVSPLDGKTYTVQYFERAVFELHPENAGTEYEVLLSQLGKFRYDARQRAVPISTTGGPSLTPTRTAVPTFTPRPTGPTATPAPVPDEVVAWLRKNALPFNTSQPGTDYSDLMPIKQMIGNARIVSLGEATHATSEFFAMKHRILEFLVKEMGFNVFGIEDSWAATEAVNEYVHGGQGTAEAALRSMDYWTWRSTEVLDMIKWVRAYNDDPAHTRKVSFRGFDMQEVGKPAALVLNYLRKVDPGQVENATALYSCITVYGGYQPGYRDRPEGNKAECRANLESVRRLIEERRAEYEGRSSAREYANAVHAARVMLQAEECNATLYCEVRDRYMAENAAWLLEQAGPDARIVLWAHNMHIGRFINTTDGYVWTSMGKFLHERFGHDMYVIGFTFARGSFIASLLRNDSYYGPARHEVEPPPNDSYEHYLASASMPRMMIDLRSIKPGSPATDWLIGPRRLRAIGAIYDPTTPERWFADVSLTEGFDLLIYFQDTKEASVLPP